MQSLQTEKVVRKAREHSQELGRYLKVYISTNSIRGFFFSTPIPVFVIYRLFNDGHSDQCEVISYCNFNLHSLISNAKHLFQRRQWQATPVLLPRKSHGWRSLVGCIPWGRYESVATERLHFHFSLSRNGEGNGNPLQCSCLKNPRDGGAWWAALYGIAQSRTRLK